MKADIIPRILLVFKVLLDSCSFLKVHRCFLTELYADGERGQTLKDRM